MFQIGLGEYVITDSENEYIITNALGSCVALIVYCEKTKCTAMAHIVLPIKDEIIKNNSGKEAYYADDITPRIIDFFLKRKDCQKRSLRVTLVGGSISNSQTDFFKIGQRNLQVIKNILNDYGIKYNEKETLGHFSRTVRVYVDTGEVVIIKNKMFI
jgi:chemotaxis protein CheD